MVRIDIYLLAYSLSHSLTFSSSFLSNSFLIHLSIIAHLSGVIGLFGRGLKTRILANGLQGIMFTIIWYRISSFSPFFQTLFLIELQERIGGSLEEAS